MKLNSPVKMSRFDQSASHLAARINASVSASDAATITNAIISAAWDDEERESDVCSLPRRAGSEQRTHHNAEIVARNKNEISVVNIFATAQPGSAHAAALHDMSEAAFDDLAAFAHGLLAT
jgi:hypothetical protein